MGKIKRLIIALLLAGSLLTGIAGTAGAVPGGGGGGTGGGSTTSTLTQTENYNPTNSGAHACQGGHNCSADFSQNGSIG
jgi:hypothetical protein